eukprot:scaffold14934_cov58-Cyclotella_meneghiniana.AAC.2
MLATSRCSVAPLPSSTGCWLQLQNTMSEENEQSIESRQQWAALPWTEAIAEVVGGPWHD